MPKKILLADDSITIQKVVELTFSDGDYEVSAVNNGAKAIQKLAELRPDIILSDIIMPEKNGYEVCEFVKSHPEYRNIPVILLTGTFEPFDPDRADKAGCDAVVTKPFESQSLIQKVEELIASAQSAPPAPPAAEPVPEPAAFAADTSPWAEPEPTPQVAFPAHDADIFAAPAAPEPPAAAAEPSMETPFDSGAFGGETRAFPRMSFDELQQMTPEATGGETRAFPRMSFEELQQMTATPEPAPEPTPPPAAPEPPAAAAEPSWEPFGAIEPPPAEDDRSTHAIPPLSLDEIPQAAEPFATPEPPPAAPEPSPWDEPAPMTGGETRAFPRMSFEELQQMSAAATPEPEPPPPPAPEPAPEPSPWDEPAPMTGGETRAFPRMSFEELQAMSASVPAEEPSPWSEPAVSPFEATEAPTAEVEAMPFAEPEPEPEPEAPFEPEMVAAEPEPLAEIVNPQITDNVVPASSGDLTDEQIDRIARRVVQLMSEQVVRNIAWEVIPDLAEMVVKERIRQLESEA